MTNFLVILISKNLSSTYFIKHNKLCLLNNFLKIIKVWMNVSPTKYQLLTLYYYSNLGETKDFVLWSNYVVWVNV